MVERIKQSEITNNVFLSGTTEIISLYLNPFTINVINSGFNFVTLNKNINNGGFNNSLYSYSEINDDN